MFRTVIVVVLMTAGVLTCGLIAWDLVQARKNLSEALQLEEEGKYCDSLELYFLASSWESKYAFQRIGFLYARGDCLKQDLTLAALYFRKSSSEASGQYFFNAANDLLIRYEKPISEADVMEKVKKLLLKSKELKFEMNDKVVESIYGLNDENRRLLVNTYNSL